MSNYSWKGTPNISCDDILINNEKTSEIVHETLTDGSQTDVFQLGVVLFFLIFGVVPFHRDDKEIANYYTLIKKENWPAFWNAHKPLLRERKLTEKDDIISLLTMMLQHAPTNRLEICDVREDQALDVDDEYETTVKMKKLIRKWNKKQTGGD